MLGLFFLALLLAAQELNAKISPRMIGGQIDTVANFPHSVFLIIDSRQMCGASIIHDRLLLTAAHCLYGKPPTTIVEARIGSDDVTKAPQKIRAKWWLTHKDYAKKQFDHDLCMIYLRKSIVFGEKVKKVLLGFDIEPKAGLECYIAGWGATAQKEMNGLQLMSAKQVERTAAECTEVYPKLSERQFCAGDRRNDHKSFLGNSGSALVYDGFKQIGLVSGGKPNISGFVVYNSIYHHKHWISYAISTMLYTDC